MTHDSTIEGTIGGTVLALIAIPSQTVTTTILCAAIGAIVSFIISSLLKETVLYFKRKKTEKTKTHGGQNHHRKN